VLHVLGEQHIATGIERGLDDQRIPEGERMILMQPDSAKDEIRRRHDRVVLAPDANETSRLGRPHDLEPDRGYVELREHLRTDDEALLGRRAMNLHACELALGRILPPVGVDENVGIEEAPHRLGLRSDNIAS
jgi:hypothetical protein